VGVSLGVLIQQRLLDFNVSFTEEQQREGRVEYNYRRGGHAMDTTPVPEPVRELAAMSGTDPATYARDRPGLSAFVLEDGVAYHTYSTYVRGLDGLWGMYQWHELSDVRLLRRNRASNRARMTHEPRNLERRLQRLETHSLDVCRIRGPPND